MVNLRNPAPVLVTLKGEDYHYAKYEGKGLFAARPSVRLFEKICAHPKFFVYLPTVYEGSLQYFPDLAKYIIKLKFRELRSNITAFKGYVEFHTNEIELFDAESLDGIVNLDVLADYAVEELFLQFSKKLVAAGFKKAPDEGLDRIDFVSVSK